MSMSTHVVAIRPPDQKWLKMKKVYEACMDAGTRIPEEVEQFFGFEPPDDQGVIIDLDGHPCRRIYGAEGVAGIEVDITTLPDDVTVIRFYNSW